MAKPFRFPKPIASATLHPILEQTVFDDEDCNRPYDPLHLTSDGMRTELSLSQLCLLVSSFGGLQVLWSTIFTNGTVRVMRSSLLRVDLLIFRVKPYLVSLGMPKSCTALVWAAPPLCGCILQPYFGSISDSSCHPLGRRRPFMLYGALGITIFTCSLGWADTLAAVTAAPVTTTRPPSLAIAYAIASVWCLSVAIQPFQCAARALVVDMCPQHQQSSANIWAARCTALGNVVGCGIGSLPVFTDETSRFRLLCFAAVVAVNITCALTCLNFEEPAGVVGKAPKNRTKGIVDTFGHLYQVYQRDSIRRNIYRIQAIAWTGWFGILFFSTSYVSEKWSAFSTSNNAVALAGGSQLGTLASLILAWVSLFTTAILPVFVQYQKPSIYNDEFYPVGKMSKSRRVPQIAWSASLVAAAIIMLSSFFVNSTFGAIVLVAAIGIPWSVAMWAPFTLLGEAILDEHWQNSIEHDPGAGRDSVEDAGAAMGLHNVALSLPQVLAAGLCYGILAVAKSFGSHDGVGWIFRFSGLAFLCASWFAYEPNPDV